MTSLELEHAIGYSGGVADSLHMHPNGTHIVYVAGGCVVIADLNDAHNQVFLRGHDDNISTLTVSPSGRYISSGQKGDNADVIIWDFEKKSLLYRQTSHDHGISALAFNDDERLLLSAGDEFDKRIFIWDLHSGLLNSSTTLSYPITAAAWGGSARDIKRRITDRYLLATVGGRQLLLWTLDPRTGEMLSEKCVTGAHIRDYTAVVFSPDGEFVYASSDSGDISCFQVKNRVLQGTLSACSAGVRMLRILQPPNNPPNTPLQMVVGGGDGSLSVLNGFEKNWSDAGQVKLSGAVTSLTAAPNGNEVMAGTAKSFMYRLRPAGMALSLVSENHANAITAVVFPHDFSDRVATASSDSTIRVWDLNDYSVVSRGFVKDAGFALTLGFGVETVISGWTDGVIRCFDSETGELLWVIPNAHKGGVSALVVSRNRKFVCTGGHEGEVRVWDIRGREMVAHLKEHILRVTDLVLLDDDTHLISCSKDRSLLCWDLRREKRVSAHTQRMGGINSIALFPDQMQFLSVGQEKKITYWDLREAHPHKTIYPAHRDEATCIAMSASGRIFATGGTDFMVIVWDFESGSMIQSNVGHSSSITSLKFSPDDKQLVSVGLDGNIFVWNVYQS